MPGESKGELPMYIEPKLKARRILSVLKCFSHRFHIDVKACSEATFHMKDGRSRQRIEGKDLLSTRS